MGRSMVVRERDSGVEVHRFPVRAGVDEERVERGMVMRVDAERFTFGIEDDEAEGAGDE